MKKFKAAIPRMMYWSTEAGGTDVCPECGARTEAESHTYLIGIRYPDGETAAALVGSHGGFFCPVCPTIILSFDTFSGRAEDQEQAQASAKEEPAVRQMTKLRVIQGRAGGADPEPRPREEPRGARAETDAVTYVSRKGRTYYLFQVRTKAGKARYVFRRDIEGPGEAVATIPDGFEIAESVNSIVSLRVAVASPIRAEEIEVVRAALRRHAHLARFRAEEVKGEIVVFEPIGGASPELLESLRKYSPFVGTPNLERLEQRVQYSPVLRFRLVDEETRRFHTSRMTYRGEGGMMPLMRGGGSIEEVAERFCSTLGRDSFFELY